MLTDCYPPRLGGIESQVRDLSRQLVLAGHEVEVFTATTGPNGERGGVTPPPATTASRCTGSRSRCRAASRSTRSHLREVRRRLAAGRLRRRARPPRCGEPVRDGPRARRPRRRPAGHRHLPLRHRPVDRRVPGGGPPRALGRARRRAQRGVDDGGCPRVRGGPRSGRRGRAQRRGCRVVAAGDRARRGGPTAIRCTSCPRCGWSPASARWRRWGCCAAPAPSSTRPCRCARRSSGRARSAGLMERYLRTRGMDWVELPGRVGRRSCAGCTRAPTSTCTTARLEAFGIAPLEARAAGRAGRRAPRAPGSTTSSSDGVEGLLADSDVGTRRRAGPPGRRRRPARPDARSPARPPRRRRTGRGVLAATLAEYHRAGVPVG